MKCKNIIMVILWVKMIAISYASAILDNKVNQAIMIMITIAYFTINFDLVLSPEKY